nr:retrotransposon-related protein [Tanacetum cinerariifolium]
MVSQTRSSIVVDDETRESLWGTIAILMREDMEKQRDEMRNASTVDNGNALLRNQGRNQRQNMLFTRITKVEFQKFGVEDVKGWMYKCLQFFKVDNVHDDKKRYNFTKI